MYRIKLQSGEESEFNSFEELSFGIVSGIIGPDDEIYHARASKWLPIQAHPDYKRAAAQAPPPPPSPAMVSQTSTSPAAGVGTHDPPEKEAGQDLMTLLDLEELTAFDPGKVQESAPLQEKADPEGETAELEPIEVREPTALETNGHAAQGHDEAGHLDEPEAATEDATTLEPEEPAAEMDAEDEDPARAALDIEKETELDDRDEATMAELALSDDEAVAELEDHDSATDDAESDQAESELDEVDGVTADGSRDIDYVAAEYQDDEPTLDASADDEPDVAVLDDLPATEHAEDSQDIDYVAAEDVDDVPMMESAVAADEDEDEDKDPDEAADEPSMDQEAHSEDYAAEDEEPVEDDEPATEDTLEVEEEVVEEAADLEDGDTDEDVEWAAEPVAQADDDLEAEEEVVEEETDLEDGDTDDDIDLDAEPVAQADDYDDDDDDMDDGDPLLGGPVVVLDHSMEDELGDTEVDDELQPEEELVAAAEVADPIDAFQPAMDDDPFRDTFSPTPELDSPRRFPVLPVAIAAGVVVMAALGWILMGASGSDGPATVPDPPTPAPAASIPVPSPDLSQQSLAAEDPSEDVQRRYDEAYDRARSRLDADLRRAGFAAVFAPGNFASEDSMVTARAAIAAASIAVKAYAGREQAIRDDFPDADPTGKESRVHRELAEDLLAVSQRIYSLLLANTEAFAIRKGAMTITDPAVESEYTRLLGEVNRLMALAAGTDEEQAATVRRIAAAIGATRPPALPELAPPPSLPADL